MVTVRDGGGSFENPEPGSYAAVCSRVIDLGTQDGEYKGKPTKRREVLLSWELSEKMSDGRPFQVSRFFTASLGEKANLRSILEAWRGAAFTKEELEGFDLSRLLGKPCLVSLVLNDKNKIRVGGVSKMPKGMDAPGPSGLPIHFDLDNFNPTAYGLLSEKLKEIISKSPEYALVATKSVADVATANHPHDDEPPAESEEVPF